MTWFFAILVVALIGGVAVVASGRGGSMAESFDDRPDALVPADGPLVASDLRQVRFSTAFRGYRMSEVDALLDRLAAELERREGGVPDAGSTAAPGGGPTAGSGIGSDTGRDADLDTGRDADPETGRDIGPETGSETSSDTARRLPGDA